MLGYTTKRENLSLIMILFGVVEIIASIYFTQRYGIDGIYPYIIIFLNALIIIAGVVLYAKRSRSMMLAVVLLLVNIGGRIFLILSSLYPFSAVAPGIAMLLGTLIASSFIFYMWLRLDQLR